MSVSHFSFRTNSGGFAYWLPALLLTCLACGALLASTANAQGKGDAAKGDAAKSAAGKKAPAQRLSYNDDTAEGKRSIAGTGEMVSFTLPSDNAQVAGVRIHGSRYGHPQPPKEDFMIYLLSADGSEVVATKTAPYSRFKRADPKWVDIRFPKPVDVPKEFWVCVDFRAAQTKGVYVSTDSSSDGAHSRVGLPGGEPQPAKIEGDWMIEVLLAK